ncbi:DUF1491 family protein [Tsuneonella mangrovi]|uniref:DUF1491 family protein n=1 Tax=Tsuneonella mangrovi TaxID=1982042 RepID=UPI000BA206A5|nr:DUF1491 family protein [Tsuneonella mangrovi]
MDERLPAHLEVAAIRRLAEGCGGFATVLAKGERDAGTIVIVVIGSGKPATLFERMPQLDGTRAFVATKAEEAEKQREFSEYITRRSSRDPDLWIIEADVADRDEFMKSLPQ